MTHFEAFMFCLLVYSCSVVLKPGETLCAILVHLFIKDLLGNQRNFLCFYYFNNNMHCSKSAEENANKRDFTYPLTAGRKQLATNCLNILYFLMDTINLCNSWKEGHYQRQMHFSVLANNTTCNPLSRDGQLLSGFVICRHNRPTFLLSWSTIKNIRVKNKKSSSNSNSSSCCWWWWWFCNK